MSPSTHEREHLFWEKDDCLGDRIYDRKYIARRGPSISPINSSIAFRLRPIMIYLHGRGVTPSMDPEKKKERCGSKRKNGGGQKKRGDSLWESFDSGVRASVWKGFRQQVSSGAERWKSRVGIYHPKNLDYAHTSLVTNQSIKRGRGLYRRRCGLNSFIG